MAVDTILGGQPAAPTGTAAPAGKTPPPAPPHPATLDGPPPAAPGAPGAAAKPAAGEAAKTTPPPGGEKQTQEGSKPGATEGVKKDGPPAKLELKFAEGVEADPKLVGLVEELANTSGLKGEDAQKLADGFVDYLQRTEQARVQSWGETRKAWVESIRADKELGGEAFDKNALVANKGLEKFGSAALRKVLTETGFGDHPEIVRHFYRLGLQDAEDSVGGTASQGAGSTPGSFTSLYDKSPLLK